jgi:NACalpha-BTF3-like transcription factor
MILITRSWGNATVLLCALLLQNCQSNSLRATEEDRLEGDSSSASARRKRASSELSTMQSLTLPSASPAAHVPPSRFSTTLAHKQDLSTSPSTLATMANLPTAPHDLPVGASYAVPLGNKLGALSTDDSRMCVSKVEGVLREMPSEEEDSKPPAERRYLNLAPGDELANKRRAGEEVEPAKAIQFSDVLLVAAQDNNCRQQALEALGRIAQASLNMFSECLPSLRAAAKARNKAVRLLALKTLGEVEWKHYFGEVEPAPDLPQDMVTILDSACPFWPGKQVRDTHLLVLIPAKVNGQPFSLNLLRELIQNPKNGGHATRYRYYGDTLKVRIGASSPAASYWLLVTRDVLPGSRHKSYRDQKKLVADQARRASLPYELPKALEAATAVLTHYVRDGERLYSDRPRTYTRCQELIQSQFGEYPAVVGGFESSGLLVHDFLCDYDHHDRGVVGCRKLNRCIRREVLNILLAVAGSEPTEAIQFLDVLLVAAQDNGCRQQALKALGQMAEASLNMFSEYLPFLRAAAKARNKEGRLLVLKTLGEVEWKHYFGEVEPAPDLPSNMAAILDGDCPFWPDKKVRDTHLLVLIPAKVNGQPFSLNLLRELIQHPNNGGHRAKYRYYASGVQAQIGTASPAASYWLLMTRAVLPGSLNKNHKDQKELIAKHARRTGVPYALPKALEAAAAILMHHVRNGERLYSENDGIWAYTRCQELVRYRSDEYPTVVGGFESSGLNIVSYYCDYANFGIAGCRKLNRCARWDAASSPLAMAEVGPNKSVQLLNSLLVATQDNDRRQHALDRVAKASPNTFSECLSSLRAVAKTGDEIGRLRALKTLGEVKWKRYFGDVASAPDLPSDMTAILDSTCPFWPGRKVKDTHLLVLIPARVNDQPFSLNLLHDLVQHPSNGGHKTQYRYYGSGVKEQLGASSPAASYWLLMTRDVLPGSRDKSYGDQKKLVADHARRTGLPYELPQTLEAATAILAHYVRNGERLYSDNPWTYTRCQEWVCHEFNQYPVVVGGFLSSGLFVIDGDYFLDYRVYGVAGCRRFF